MKRNGKRKGITMIEVIISVVLVAIVFAVGFQLLTMGMDFEPAAKNEFELQQSVRTSMDKLTTQLRYSTAVFIMSESQFNVNNIQKGILDRDWNYFGILDTVLNGQPAQEVVEYIYDKESGTHKKRIVIEAHIGWTYEFRIDKGIASTSSKLSSSLDSIDNEGKITSYSIVVKNAQGLELFTVPTAVEVLNSLQVIDWAPGDDEVGRALAYRADERTNKTIGRIAIILDSSGSMSSSMIDADGKSNSRLAILKKAAAAMLTKFYDYGDLKLCIIPFSWTANVPSGFSKMYPDGEYVFKSTEKMSALSEINTAINAMSASGTTNTGDALRRAYYAFQQDDPPEEGAVYRDYVIILNDGDSSYATIEPYEDASNPLYPGPYVYPGPVPGPTTSTRVYQKDYNTLTGDYEILDEATTLGYMATKKTCMLAGNGNGMNGIIDYHSRTYVEHWGTEMQSIRVRPFVVALSNSVSAAGIRNVAGSLGLAEDSSDVFRATDFQALTDSFDRIIRSITDDLFFINGPKQTP